MIFSAEIILTNRDPQVLSADYSAVMNLIQQRDAARTSGPASLSASPPKAAPKTRKRKKATTKA
ncbi:MAG TPA: hypothetical protein VFE16_05490 [Candidatus Cybelea sp.]|nr:hypothetical protein [Candidatus Cybelea sp.]